MKIGDFGLVTAMETTFNDDDDEDEEEEEEDDSGGDFKGLKKGDGKGGRKGQRHTNRVGTHTYMSPEQVGGCVVLWVDL